MLCAHDITFSYNGTSTIPILSHVSLCISPGEMVWLRGASGVGKTTLCKILAGFETPSLGSVELDEKPLPKQGVCPVQMVGQHPEFVLDPKMRMKDSLREAGGNCREELLDALNIRKEWLTRFPHELSGGEMQRFCIVRALMTNPSYLIADEISTMLDAITQARIFRLLQNMASTRNMGILFTTHSEPLGKEVATRTINL